MGRNPRACFPRALAGRHGVTLRADQGLLPWPESVCSQKRILLHVLTNVDLHIIVDVLFEPRPTKLPPARFLAVRTRPGFLLPVLWPHGYQLWRRGS